MSAPNGYVTPIADLSYRDYDGPMGNAELRWWVIAKRLILNAIKLRSLWVFTVLSGWYFIIMLVILFFLQQISGALPQAQQTFQQFLSRMVWQDQFIHGFSFAQVLLLVVALIVGAGAIANDNRSNALLIYLSKPCSKLDYVIGKWVGIFLVVLGVITIPSLAFYAYGALNFRSQGFLSNDPWLLLRVLCLLPLSAAIHASLILAISSMFRQGWIAGATYAGLYFLTDFFTLQGTWAISSGSANPIVKVLYYCSIDGVQNIALARSILRGTGSSPFGNPLNNPFYISPPPLPWCLLIVAVLLVASLSFVWTRVRAVEVV